MKKILLTIFAMVVILYSLTGCYGEKSGNPLSAGSAVPTGNSPDKSDRTKLVLWCYYEGTDRFQKIVSICNSFNASQEGIEVTPEYIPFADINKQLLIGYSSGRAPDLAIIDNPVHAAFAAQGMLLDITDKIKPWINRDQYFKAPWESCLYNGRLYGLPLGNNCLALFYNKDLLQAAGLEPPRTWSEFEKTAKKLTNKERYGIGISAPLDEQGTFQFLPWLLSTGAAVNTLNSPEGIKAFDFLTGLIEEGVMSKEVMNWTPSDELNQFISGRIAMMVNGPWQIPELETKAPNLKYGVVGLPMDKKPVSVLGGENIVAVNGESPDAALKVLLYFERSDVLKGFSIGFGYVPPRKDIASDSYWSADPVWSVFKKDVENSVPRGPDVKWPEKSNAVITALQEAMSQLKSPEKAAYDAQEKIGRLSVDK